MKFSEKLIRLRKIKGITQDELATEVGVSRQAVYKWESGQSYPEVSKLIEIKRLFEISIDDLLDENYEVVLPEKKKRRRAEKKAEATSAEVKDTTALKIVENEEKISHAPAMTIEEAVENQAEVAEDKKADSEENASEIQVAKAAPLSEEKKEDKLDASIEPQKKKVGFFGRLFGRK